MRASTSTSSGQCRRATQPTGGSSAADGTVVAEAVKAATASAQTRTTLKGLLAYLTGSGS